MTSKSKRVEIPVLTKADAAVRVVAPIDKTPPAITQREVVRSPTGLQKTGFVVGVLGVAAIGVGVGLGLHANNLETGVDASCPDTNCGDQHTVDLNTRARSYALFANVGFITGGVAVVSGIAMWVLGGSKGGTVSLIPTLGPGDVGFAVTTVF